MSYGDKAEEEAFEACRRLFDASPDLKTSDAMIRPRDGIRYCDLWNLWCAVMNLD